MKKIFLILMILTSLILIAEENKVFMWKANKIGSESDVYLLGSIHFAKKDLYPLDSRIEKAFENSDFLSVEIDITNFDKETSINKIKEQAKIKDDGHLFDLLSSDMFFKLDKLLYKYGLNIISYNDLEPWFFVFVLSSLPFTNTDFSSEYGIDMHFIKQAKKSDKPIIDLESLDSQIKSFASISDSTQILLLEDIVNRKGERDHEKILENIFTAWKKGDVKRMEKNLLQEMDTESTAGNEFNSKLNVKRNLEMVKKIEKYFDENQNHFVVVGSAHLIGENGIIELLRSVGYIVKQQ